MTQVRIGLCGFSMAMANYFREFPMVEVQQTFYEPPGDATLTRWRSAAPDDFEFTLKAWQRVTHEGSSPTYRRSRTVLTDSERTEVGSFRTSEVVMRAWERTLECSKLLRATAVLLQCPRSFGPTDLHIDQMRRFLANVERPPELRLLWEPRGPWPLDIVRSLCEEFGLAHVVDPFVTRTTTPDALYFRLHGIGGAQHAYTDRELRELVDMIPSTSAPAYVLFNNLPRVGDARRFAALIEGSRLHLILPK